MKNKEKFDIDSIEIVNGVPRKKQKTLDVLPETNSISEETPITSIDKDVNLNSETSIVNDKDVKTADSKPLTTNSKYAWLTKPNKFTIILAIFLAITLPLSSLILGYFYGRILLDSSSKKATSDIINRANTLQIGNYKVAIDNNRETLDTINAFKYTSYDKLGGGEGYSIIKGDVDMDKNFTYYNVGKILDGKYEDYTLVFGFSKDEGYLTGRFPIVLAYYDLSSEIILFDTTVYQDNDGKDQPYKFIPNIVLQSTVVRDTDPSIYSYLSKSSLNVSKIKTTSVDTAVYDYPEEQMTPSIIDDNKQQTYTYNKDTEGAIYTRMSEGFYKAYYINPTFDTSRITWTKPLTNVTSTYTYKSVGGCFRYKTEVVVPDFDLSEAGKNVDGDILYDAKDYKKDSFVKHLYDSDYIQGEIYKYNDDTGDDKTPYTLDTFVKHHPVFYWKDPFGRYIRFVNNDYVFAGGCAKPAIYLYPQTETNINVSIKVDGELGHTDPKYNNGWTVTADTKGNLTDGNSNYDYLYWDAQFNEPFYNNNGYMIEKSQLNTELEKILINLGFNEKEKTQFLEYWLPIMNNENKPYIFVTFVDESVMDKEASLTVSPKPDTYKRYFMLFKGEDKDRTVSPLTFDKFERKGFTLFEWGGAKIQ